MQKTGRSRSRFVSIATTVALVAAGLSLTVLTAPAASAAVSPVVDNGATSVTADALPTVQIDGVVWQQAIVGNTVYAVGSFANARPAGAAPGTNLTPRSNMLSYNLTTGELNTSFNPVLNAQAYTVTASPDGSRIYVGGMFTKVNGVTRNRIAALDPTTGALITTFGPSVDYTVRSIVASGNTVYAGGAFSAVNGKARTRLAAWNATTGALLAWAPTVDATVNAMVMSPDGKLIVGGSFQNSNGSPAYGMARLDAVDGTLLPWNATNLVRNAGESAAILSLKTDGTAIYGTGYVFGAGGNLEGTFSADPVSGNINWVEDCHGDTYDNYPAANAVYTVSHAHYCGNVGGFPQSDPWAINMRHALAFTKTATGTAGADPYGYYNYTGTPTPSMTTWFPDLDTGSYTGKTQAAWSVTGNSQYIVMGGEFPSVNNKGQQGLVRFAVKPIAPSKVGPSYAGSKFLPGVIGLPSGQARISWQANSDRDNKTLTYKLLRDNVQIYTADADSTFWNRPTMGYIDTSVVAGTTYKYRITATDADGNVAQSDLVSFTAMAAGAVNAYASKVIADGAAPYWPMNEQSGTTLLDNAGFNDADSGAGITRNVLPGAVASDAATTFDGATSASTRTAVAGPNVFSTQAWIKTTTTSGGKILGFGGNATGNSGNYDRQIYMDNAGHIYFGVYPGFTATVNSSTSYNDGQWHQITASMGPDGMKLYVDGKLAGQRADVTTGQDYQGYWRVGGDSLGSWPGQPSSNYFAGAIDEVAIYPTVLTRAKIDAQWVASGRTSTIPQTPADAYGAAVFNDSPLLYWRLGESTGTSAADSGPNADQTGVYKNGVTLGAAGGIKGTTDTATGFDGNDDFVTSSNSYSNPTNYSVEAWFKTSSTNGGKIIGFGDNPNGLSGSYDRHVYIDNAGKVTFGTWTGQTNTATTSASYNDGKWHQVVASQSSTDGIKLYLDGSLVATNGATGAQSYTGYWKIGGDNQWGCCSAYLASTIDDVAVYNSVLTPAQVSNHFTLGNIAVAPPNQAPTAAFTSSSTELAASFNASTSADADGTISSYAWDFGDGTTGSDVSPQHTYGAAGTYQVKLTVTDNGGSTAAVTNPITVTVTPPPVNVPPTVSFSVITAQLTANFTSTAADSDGTIAGYAWTFGDSGTSTDANPTHVYTAAGTYPVSVTVTDDDGATATSTQNVQVTAPPVNVAPTAKFTSTVDGATVNVESTSTDTDGTIAGVAWDFGDGGASTDSAAVHTYAATGTYTVTLTVTDDDGAPGTTSKAISVTKPPAANAPPTAAFTVTANGLQAAVDGSASTDTDGTIAAYSWDFGDDSNDMLTTATATHAYLAAGTYQVQLTVTDNKGATGTVTHPVTVSSPTPAALVSDTFTRTVVGGFGTADTGGGWTITGGAGNFSVGGGTGKIKMAAAGSGPSASLAAVAGADVDLTVKAAVDKASTGGGTYLSTAVRKVGNSEYRVTTKFLAGGSVQLQLVKIVNGTSTSLGTATVAGLTYAANDVVNIRFQAVGSSSVALKAKVWKVGTTEPAGWQASATDATATLSGAGGVALYPYLSGSSTAGAVVATIDDLKVTAATP